ncbi:arylsulfatase [Hymenobacter sp. H14-R3]|uniref:arylsulfatase n=1 Tax=Hymenobacter sp. H14-R3 TaxID=3046308 RepID=UPI0024B974A1|nr:arylsulfatase [Hymenobacter sp. H14-R3]MDJ0367025.1 arylsulfatase [Hymenobacter sp. H14-R3]
MRRPSVILALLLAAGLAGASGCNRPPARPNVVLILTDDQGWGDLSANKNPWVTTPNIDRLAQQGTSFEHFYVSPLCAPTRASLLTGRYHLSTGVVSVSKGLETMASDETTLAELFRANGYQTGMFGKWHSGQHYPNRPNDQGFSEFLGFCAGHWSNYFDTKLDHNGQPVPTAGYISDVLTDAALKFIAANQAKPFFCYIPYNAPHSPFQVPDAYFNKYKAKGLSNELACVYGMVSNLDDNVGRVLAFLKERNLEENTIVIFMTDNGPNGTRYNGDMRGIKGSVHEGGMRVPFFIRWPTKIPARTVLPLPAAHIDVYPTLAGLCALQPVGTKKLDGISLAPYLLAGNATAAPDRKIFTHVNFMEVPATLNAGGFRSNQYRFVYEHNAPQLYDVDQDPGEKNDLAAQNPALTQQFLRAYQAWFTQSISGISYERPIVLSERGVVLPVYEANVSAGIKLKEGHGWAHDWAEQWPSTRDSLTWNIDCQTPGTYTVALDYLCTAKNVGSVLSCRVGQVEHSVTISRPFQAAQLPSPDRVPRKEAYEMAAWGQLVVGTFRVPAGKTSICLKALKITGATAAEINGLQLSFDK